MSTMEMETVLIDAGTLQLWVGDGERPRRTWDLWDEDMIRRAVENVNRGALLLDGAKPQWQESIIPADLDMADGSFCIIGHVYGGYENVGIPFGMDVMAEAFDIDDTDEMAVEHGFLTLTGHPPYPLLDRVWVYLLTERNKRGRPVFLALPSKF